MICGKYNSTEQHWYSHEIGHPDCIYYGYTSKTQEFLTGKTKYYAFPDSCNHSTFLGTKESAKKELLVRWKSLVRENVEKALLVEGKRKKDDKGLWLIADSLPRFEKGLAKLVIEYLAANVCDNCTTCDVSGYMQEAFDYCEPLVNTINPKACW